MYVAVPSEAGWVRLVARSKKRTATDVSGAATDWFWRSMMLSSIRFWPTTISAFTGAGMSSKLVCCGGQPGSALHAPRRTLSNTNADDSRSARDMPSPYRGTLVRRFSGAYYNRRSQ
jgi:hypothetical protein